MFVCAWIVCDTVFQESGCMTRWRSAVHHRSKARVSHQVLLLQQINAKPRAAGAIECLRFVPCARAMTRRRRRRRIVHDISHVGIYRERDTYGHDLVSLVRRDNLHVTRLACERLCLYWVQLHTSPQTRVSCARTRRALFTQVLLTAGWRCWWLLQRSHFNDRFHSKRAFVFVRSRSYNITAQ